MVKRLFRRILMRERASSDTYYGYLKKQGVQMGERVKFYSPEHTMIDISCPWLISIGSDVAITYGVVILTHDYAWKVLKRLEGSGEILGAQGPIRIGNNVFIGMNTVIMRGVTIGDNVVIGAGSVVTGTCESNSVYAGNPAKKIMSITEYRDKRRGKQFAEAKELALEYRRRFDRNPPREEFREYFPLFCTAEQANKIPEFRRQMETAGNFDDCYACINESGPMFDSYESFLSACYKETGSDRV